MTNALRRLKLYPMLDSNQRPSVCKTAALATELIGHVVKPVFVETDGFEPSTPAVSERCSTQAELRFEEAENEAVRRLEPQATNSLKPAGFPLSYVSKRVGRNTRVRTEDTGVRARHVANYAIFLSARLQGRELNPHRTTGYEPVAAPLLPALLRAEVGGRCRIRTC